VLVEAGSELDARDATLSTPLLTAADAGHTTVVVRLLEVRAAFLTRMHRLPPHRSRPCESHCESDRLVSYPRAPPPSSPQPSL
jgi:ankyrin repeat protein